MGVSVFKGGCYIESWRRVIFTILDFCSVWLEMGERVFLCLLGKFHVVWEGGRLGTRGWGDG